jgi:hypothetical protein
VRHSGTSGLWTFLALVAVGSSLFSLATSSEVQGEARACCFENADCEFLNRSTCEDQMNGTSQDLGTNCSTVVCPLSCGFANAPECNGGCPDGQTCFAAGNFTTPMGQGGGAGPGMPQECACFTPPGGECIPEADTCPPGFVCDPSSEVCCNRICDGPGESCDSEGICRGGPAAPAPAMSHTGLLMLVALLMAAGSFSVVRRRSRGR